MTDHLHPQRETYPLVNTDDQLVAVFRHHLPPTHTPTCYFKAIGAAVFRIDMSRTLDDRPGVTVLDYTAGTTDTLTITVDGGGPTVLTEGTEFDAVVSNEETALQIAAAINAAALGLTATADGVNVYVAADAGVQTFTLASGDPAAWSTEILAQVGTTVSLSANDAYSVDLPFGTTDPTMQVAFLKIFSGRLSVDLRSPVEVRTYFRQPARLSGNTGHPGGWPTTP